jgi:RNA polymerase sigma-70 factor, ECF subfamily
MAIPYFHVGFTQENGFMSNTYTTQRGLIDGIIAGERKAAYEFHERYSKRISCWVWRLLGTDQEHADIVQQIFINIFESLPGIKKAASLDAWVDSITIKTTRLELRKRKTRRTLFLARKDDSPNEPRDETSPFKQQHIKHFYKIINRMPTDDRIIFILRFLESCTIEEIAALGNYSTSTAKRRLKRAKTIFEKSVLNDFSLVSLVEEYHAI